MLRAAIFAFVLVGAVLASPPKTHKTCRSSKSESRVCAACLRVVRVCVRVLGEDRGDRSVGAVARRRQAPAHVVSPRLCLGLRSSCLSSLSFSVVHHVVCVVSS